MTVSYPPARPQVQVKYPNTEIHLQQLSLAVNRLSQGHMNAVAFVTLTAGAATTVIEDTRISAQTFAGFMPQTATAAAELPTLWAVCTNGTMTIHHTNSAVMDRTYTMSMIG